MSATQPSAKTPVELKQDALRALFNPQEIAWTYPTIVFTEIGRRVDCMPYPIGPAIRERFDRVFAPNNWREHMLTLNSTASCTIECRFEPGEEWVSRIGVATDEDPKIAYDTAFRRAAYGFQVARYLRNHFQAIEVVKIESSPIGKGLKSHPKLPQHYLPFDYQDVTGETARKLRDLLEQACKDSTAKGEKVEVKVAALRMVKPYGIEPDANGEVNFRFLTNRECESCMQQTHDWIKRLAASRAK